MSRGSHCDVCTPLCVWWERGEGKGSGTLGQVKFRVFSDPKVIAVVAATVVDHYHNSDSDLACV